jgi:hypothetical protein
LIPMSGDGAERMEAETRDSGADGDGWEKLTPNSADVPQSALELGKETLPIGARVAAAKRDGAGVVWFDAADGPRGIDRTDLDGPRALFEATREYEAKNPPPASTGKLEGERSGNGGSPAEGDFGTESA